MGIVLCSPQFCYVFAECCMRASREYNTFVMIIFYLYRDNVASLTLLAEMTAQAKAIEILISHVHEVCNLGIYKCKAFHLNIEVM